MDRSGVPARPPATCWRCPRRSRRGNKMGREMARSARRPKVVEPERGVLAVGAVAVGPLLASNTVLVGGSTAFLVTLFYVSANALWYQPFPHTGAFFATRSIENFPHTVSNEPETSINIVRQPPAPPAVKPEPV